MRLEEIKKLYNAILEVLKNGLKYQILNLDHCLEGFQKVLN